MQKMCGSCRQLKDEVCFGKSKRYKGLNKWCESCRAREKAYYANNRESRKMASLEIYHRNTKDPSFRIARNSRQREFSKEYRKRPETKLLVAAAHKRYMSKMEHHISRRLSFQVWYSLRLVLDKSKKKNGKHWQDLVGWSVEQLMTHLETRFTDGMSWENYGGESGWQIDHVTPRTWFKIQAVGDDEFKKCWSLDNLQPSWLKDNASKGNRFAG